MMRPTTFLRCSATEAMLSLLDLPKEERYALAIINLYCDRPI